MSATEVNDMKTLQEQERSQTATKELHSESEMEALRKGVKHLLKTSHPLEVHLQKRLQSLQSDRFNNGTYTAVGLTADDGFNICFQHILYDNEAKFGRKQVWQMMCGDPDGQQQIWMCTDGVIWEEE